MGAAKEMGKWTLFILIDDAAFFRKLVRAAPARWETVWLRTASEAGDPGESSSSAYLISESLPDGDGIALARALRSKNPAVPVVIIGQADDTAVILEAFHCGMTDYLRLSASPAEIQRMFDRIHTALENDLLPGHMANPRLQAVGPFLPLPVPGPELGPLGWISRWLGSGKHKHQANPGPLLPTGIDPTPVVCDSGIPCEDAETQAITLQVHFLGPFQVFLNGTRVEEWSGHKAQLLFAYMIYHHKRRIYRDILMDKFWPHSTPESARNCLNVTLHAMRASLQKVLPGPEVVRFKSESYFFAPEISIELDTEKYLDLWNMAQVAEREGRGDDALQNYEAAAALYHGDFLEEFLYENWTDLERANLAETYLVIMDRMSGFYASDGRPATAISLCEQILQKDNCREEIYRRLMNCYSRIGQRDKAIRIYKRCVDILKSALDVEPTATTRQLFQKIRDENKILSGR